MKWSYRKGRCAGCGKDVVRACLIDENDPSNPASTGWSLTPKCCYSDEVLNDSTLRWFSDGTFITWDEEKHES